MKVYTFIFYNMIIFYSSSSLSKETFNTHALEIDKPEQQVVNLSDFSNSDGQLPGIYRVTIYVNGEEQKETQDISFITGKDDKLVAQINTNMLKAWGVKVEAFPSLEALPSNMLLSNIDQYIPMATTDLNFNKLQLNVNIPQAAIKSSSRGWIDSHEWNEGITAARLNYNFSGSNTWHDDVNSLSNNYYANLQSGINIGPWRLRNYMTWNYNTENISHWRSVYNYLQRDIHSFNSQLILGDSYTPSDIFDSIQFSGIQLVSDDNMLPDSLRGFAPVIRGIAQSNAQITIKQNGYIIYQSYVAPGAFIISDLYPTSSSGDLDVTIKEADGTERTFIQPFSAVPIMQREGHLKYALTTGKYRSSDNYGKEPEFGQATVIYGLPHDITAYGGILYSDEYQSEAIGLGFGLGKLGSLSGDITMARTILNNDKKNIGQSYRVQYSKNFQTTGTSFTLAAYRYSTIGFYTFQDANNLQVYSDDDRYMTYNQHQKYQIDINQNIGSYGSFFFSGYQQNFWHLNSYERTLSTGWSGYINSINYNITYSYSNSPRNKQPTDQQIVFNIQVPLYHFIPKSWASYSINTRKHGNTYQQVGLSGTGLTDNNLSYNLQQSYTNRGMGWAGNINTNYKGGMGNILGGYSYDDNMRQINYGLSGGIIAHSHGITLSQPLGESLALVHIPGADNVKIQNNTGVYTNRDGYAVIPYVNPYKINRIAIDTNTLSDEVEIESTVYNVVPTEGAIVMAEFNSHIGKRVLMKIHYHGKSVPFGAQAKLKDGSSSGILNDEGLVYLTGLPDEGDIIVNWNSNQQCLAHYHLNEHIKNGPVSMIEEDCY